MARLYTLFSPIYLTLLLVLVAAVAVNAAGVSDLPSCAGPCADAAAASSGCSSSDNACLCKSDSFRTATLNCSRQVCPKEDQSTTAGMLEEMCSTRAFYPVLLVLSLR
ncbi:hypothetical protein FPV67DRAFT_830195 [Lyophyllum atratum]|nr:hypothetical protein FPV67DRAFT_830195 [Lyophyllum atratum]